ncbi:MAG: response regulator transcription factor [Candidatus Nanopelagicales bacterium]
MSCVLVVDDDATVSEVVAGYLSRAGLRTVRAADGPSALAAAAEHRPDLVVLDLMLPGIDGLEVCRRLRADRGDLPVVMLTARGEEEDRVLGLEVGADDYVTKPFSPRELVLRVQSVLRRSAPSAPGTDDGDGEGDGGAGAAPAAAGPLRDGDLVVDTVAHRATRGGTELLLTSREFDLLAHLLARPGRAFSRADLMREVWGWEYGDQSTVTVHVRRLREKVERDPSAPTRLVTVWGVGYRWDPTEPDRSAS